MATTNKGLNQPANNSNINTWDVPNNANFGYIDDALGGVTALNAATDSGASQPVSLTLTQYQKLVLSISGVKTGNLTYQVPSTVGGFWIVRNTSTGAFTTTISSGGSGTSVVLPTGVILVYSDGTNIRTINLSVADILGTLGVSQGGTGATDLAAFILAAVTNTITVGYKVTPYNAGTKSSGTFTPDPAVGNYQYATNNGAHILAAPSSDCAIDILYTNGASAGTLSFSGFTVGSSTGSVLTTTSGNKFLISIRRINGVSTYSIYALQ